MQITFPWLRLVNAFWVREATSFPRSWYCRRVVVVADDASPLRRRLRSTVGRSLLSAARRLAWWCRD